GGAGVADGIIVPNTGGEKGPKRSPDRGRGAGGLLLGGLAGSLFSGPVGWATTAGLLLYEADRTAQNYRDQLGEGWFAKPPIRPEGAGKGTPVSAREAESASLVSYRTLVNTGEMEILLEESRRKAAEAGRDIQTALSVTARPQVDTASLANAVSLAKQLLSLL